MVYINHLRNFMKYKTIKNIEEGIGYFQGLLLS